MIDRYRYDKQIDKVNNFCKKQIIRTNIPKHKNF